MGRYIADHVDGAELVVLDSDVHLICVSDVLDEVGTHVRAFLERVGLAAAAQGSPAVTA
jgi:hypothetical protein